MLHRTTAHPPGYPEHLERTQSLPNGETITVRPILPSDAAHIRTALQTADSDTLYRRFFTSRPKISDDTIAYLAEVDYRRRLALVAFASDGPIALARYEAETDPLEAEIAFVVSPDWRGLGIAQFLGQMLLDEAEANGMHRMIAYYLSTNDGAAGLLTRLGFVPDENEHGVTTAHRSLTGAE
ncbi:MAG: GNAT family N-acetyltransferase [Acidimicrobiia bacterium]|nr:GNAT family N-acetyltransferase [Acidimicrobiia bacterium]